MRNLESNRDAALKLADEVSYRIFRISMAGTTLGFKYGTSGLNQVLVSKPDNDSAGMPRTRAEWYSAENTATDEHG